MPTKEFFLKRLHHLPLVVILGFITYRVVFFSLEPIYYAGANKIWYIDGYFYMFNLIFHELFHFVFGIFGQTMHFLGGTIGEFIFPIIFGGYFFLRQKFNGVFFCLWWIGFNIVTTGAYMNDAIVMRIPLIAADSVHDWNWLFTKFNILPHAEHIGLTVFVLGAIAMVASIGGYVVQLRK